MIDTRLAVDRSSWLDAAVVVAGIGAVAVAIWLIPASAPSAGITSAAVAARNARRVKPMTALQI